MRAPFDRFIDLYYGPDTATPGALKAAGVPARLVEDEAFVDIAEPLSESLLYLTLDEVEPAGATTENTELQRWTYDYGQGDQVALTEGGEITHQVLRVESRTWPEGENYWRAHICPLLDELPSECSLDYVEEWWLYRLEVFIAGPLVKVGPTTWVLDDWTLEAEIGPLNPETCQSYWQLTGPGVVYGANTYGTANMSLPPVSGDIHNMSLYITDPH
jgi:hypothetical protein